ncbi:hypothetical protein C8Q76DRAFT_69857 [Earliella scabrosa]|nr:hypothetical protein C8Q76DRAFT_69857 [Earliella scabrosa]
MDPSLQSSTVTSNMETIESSSKVAAHSMSRSDTNSGTNVPFTKDPTYTRPQPATLSTATPIPGTPPTITPSTTASMVNITSQASDSGTNSPSHTHQSGTLGVKPSSTSNDVARACDVKSILVIIASTIGLIMTIAC